MSEDFWSKIESLGRSLGNSDEAMRKWRERGSVPPRHHLPLLKAAAAQGVCLVDDDLLSTTNRTAA